MVDRITGNKGFGPLGQINRTGKTGAGKSSGAAKNTDRVDFSSALQDAAKAQEISTTQDTARAEKIQALKAQIENGTYKPDLEKVASSLLPFIMKDS
ncbi:MAG: flagellar biosynthesis anti-sigma factor FlgM [Desulfuromonadales bacterium]|nr:flagellar biosynthesis anti-sigma factor FlgM [Desulfuromonadales bacterium]MBN2792061.1 flagellar biosynthesis anti-sigma factor FlgM [Desulfuromonadales bacterium]